MRRYSSITIGIAGLTIGFTISEIIHYQYGKQPSPSWKILSDLGIEGTEKIIQKEGFLVAFNKKTSFFCH